LIRSRHCKCRRLAGLIYQAEKWVGKLTGELQFVPRLVEPSIKRAKAAEHEFDFYIKPSP
jgi:hypothetical protein